MEKANKLLIKAFQDARIAMKQMAKAMTEAEGLLQAHDQKLFEPDDKSLFRTVRIVFVDWYMKEKNMMYIWSAKDAFHMKQIVKKLSVLIDYSGHVDAQDTISGSLLQILENGVRHNQWVYEHLSVAIVNSKFNELVVLARDNVYKGLTSKYDNYMEELAKRMKGGE